MNDSLNESGLKFFGAMSASISHELKNRFAIVNEQAGLLADLVLMAERGKPLDPERLARLAQSLKNQVSLGDALLGQMNRFAHSVDQIVGETDITAALTCILALSRRTADRRNVAMEIRLPDEAITMNVSGFRLMNLIWILLDGVMGPGMEPRQIIVSCQSVPEGALIELSGSSQGQTLDPCVAAAADLANALMVALTPNLEDGSVRILVPEQSPATA